MLDQPRARDRGADDGRVGQPHLTVDADLNALGVQRSVGGHGVQLPQRLDDAFENAANLLVRHHAPRVAVCTEDATQRTSTDRRRDDVHDARMRPDVDPHGDVRHLAFEQLTRGNDHVHPLVPRGGEFARDDFHRDGAVRDVFRAIRVAERPRAIEFDEGELLGDHLARRDRDRRRRERDHVGVRRAFPSRRVLRSRRHGRGSVAETSKRPTRTRARGGGSRRVSPSAPSGGCSSLRSCAPRPARRPSPRRDLERAVTAHREVPQLD